MSRHKPREGGLWASWSLSVLLHLAVVVIAAGFWFWSQRSRPPQRLAIEGSVVSAAELAERTAPVPDPAPPPEPEPLPEPEPEPPTPEPPPVDDTAEREAEAARLAEAQRLAAERETAEREAAERRAREAEQARQRAEQQRRERERAEQQRLERERQAREAAERQREERELAERARREAELAAQLAAEQQREAVRGSAQARQYYDRIRALIERNWVRPPTARVGLECEVRVTQVRGGTVTGVRIGRCNGDATVRESIEAAVLRSSPLPRPPDEALFERELIFNFAPED